MRFKSHRLCFFPVLQVPQPGGVLVRLKRQVLGLLSLLLGLLLAIPGVPGPGFVFVALALVWMDFPGKNRLIGTLQHKRWFRIARVMVRKKLNILLILPKMSSPTQFL